MLSARIGAATVVLLVAACNYTTATFRPYEARTSVVVGQGGAREVVKGIDLWTDGDPPRRYEILGTIQLQGYERYGSPTEVLADKVREVGGNGAIRVRASRDYHGAIAYNISAYSAGSIAVFQTDATYYAVKYLD
jgi:hypothetical protein